MIPDATAPHPGAQAVPPTGGRIAVVVKGYPRLSETFIAQELLGLQQAGLDFAIVSLRHPTDPAIHDLHREITAPVIYLPEYLHQEVGRVLRGLRWALGRGGRFWRLLKIFARDLRRDFTRNRVRRLGQACVMAREMPADFVWIYSHFLHTPGSVARYAAVLRDLPWSASAHAKDIWTTPHWELTEKLGAARWVATCTGVNQRHLARLSPRPDDVHLVYHGLDFRRFPAAPERPPRDGHDPADPVRLISVGRAVEKKGYPVLLDALKQLPDDLNWRFDHYGGGNLRTELQAAGGKLGQRVHWHGPQPRTAIIAALAAADLFVLTPIIAPDGDRDGIPNVLMEAMALGLACVTTRVSAIPELVMDGETGLLVAPDDAEAVAGALASLITHPDDRAEMGAAGAVRVREAFEFRVWLPRLLDLLAAGQAASQAAPHVQAGSGP
ncbi:MAG: glycosyltransferase family 4 protein [Rhodospirillaceae bacterium]|nr:glycosyltransferase family 4 protein [Rhodospirillaceae bacterium]